mgnify:CR=1 FL=1
MTALTALAACVFSSRLLFSPPSLALTQYVFFTSKHWRKNHNEIEKHPKTILPLYMCKIDHLLKLQPPFFYLFIKHWIPCFNGKTVGVTYCNYLIFGDTAGYRYSCEQMLRPIMLQIK